MALDGNEEVGECSGSHEDDVLARSGFVGVVRIALIFSGKERTFVVPFLITFNFREKDMARRDGVPLVTNSEVEAHRALHLESFQDSDRQAQCSSEGVGDSLERIEVRDGCEELFDLA